MPLRLPCIRHLLIAQIIVTGLALTSVLGWFLYHTPQRLLAANRIVEANHLSTTLLQAAIAAARERGLATLVLVHGSFDERNGIGPGKLETARNEADRYHNELVGHLQVLLHETHVATLNRPLSAVRRQYTDLQRARAEVEQGTGGGASPLSADRWFGVATTYIDSLGALQGGLCTLPQILLTPMAGCLLLKDEVFWLAEYAGRIRGIVTRVIADRRPLTLPEQYQLFRYGAGIDRRLKRLGQAQAQWFADDQELAQALQVTRTQFQSKLTALFQEVFEAGRRGNEYPVNAATWFESTSEGIESLRGVILATTNVIDAAVAEQRRNLILTSSLWAVTGSTFAVLLGTLALQIYRRLLVRLRQLRDATSTIGSGDLSQPVAVTGGDELSELAQDFETMRTHLLADLTKREATEERLRRTNDELQRFTSVVSHDLKAPLRAVHGLSTWIEDELAGRLSSEGQQRLALLRDRIQRMDAMINALLEYSRTGYRTAELEEVATGELVQEVVSNRGGPGRFVLTVAPDLPHLTTDRLRLQQVFDNLIGNAFEHHDRPDGHVWVSARDLGDFYEFSVTDDGPGIHASHHRLIFEMFQRLDPGRGAGTGIGLALVKKLVESVGGRVGLESSPGQGSTFCFTWPKTLGADAAPTG